MTCAALIALRLCAELSSLATRTPTSADSVETSSAAAVQVEVRAAAEPEYADPSASVTRLGPAEVEAARSRGDALADLVQRAPGAQVLDYGGPRLIGIRAGSSAQTALVVDGLPMRTPFATGLDLGCFDLESVDSLEVVRGGAGALLGEGALSGALIVRTGGARPRQSATLFGGSFGALGARGHAAGKGVSASAAYQQSSGRFAYVSRLPGLPDRREIRDNNDYQLATSALSIEGLALGGTARALIGFSAREGGVPGLETQENLQARERRQNGRARVSYERARAPLRLRAGAGVNWLDVRYRDGEVASRARFLEMSADGGLIYVARPHRLELSVRGGTELTTTSTYRAEPRARFSAGASETVRLGAAVSAFGALRGEWIGESGYLLPRLGAAYTPIPSLRFQLGAGRSLRAPAIDELYHPVEAGFAGNPALEPEQAWEAETSARFAAGGLEISLSAFARRVYDTILYTNRNAFLIRPENQGDARVFGAELAFSDRRQFGRWSFGGSGSLNVLATVLLATGAAIPTQPTLRAAAELFGGPLIGERAPFELFSRLSYASATSADVRGNVPVDDYLRLDLGLSVRPWTALALTATIGNLLDDRTLQTVQKVPLPGRSLWFAARLSFGERS